MDRTVVSSTNEFSQSSSNLDLEMAHDIAKFCDVPGKISHVVGDYLKGSFPVFESGIDHVINLGVLYTCIFQTKRN